MGRAGTRILIAAVAAVVLATGIASGANAAPGGGAGASVVKGTTAPIAEFPWLALIEYEGKVEGFGCTGTVVAPRLVLTAGHCAVSESGRVLSAGGYKVAWGTADVRQVPPTRVAAVSQVLVFPGYNPTDNLHDAALLVLAAPVGAPAIPLAGEADATLYAGGTPITIAGWGLTNGAAKQPPSVFRTGQTELGSTSFCRREWSLISTFDPASQLCATDRRRHEVSACNGDSGGPGIARRPDGSAVQVGIISMGGPLCDTAFPEIQTRVDKVSPWAASWIAAVETGAPAPAIVTPPPFRLPRLGFEDARLLAYYGLANDFGGRFIRGKYKGIGCRRIEREKVKCKVFWYLAGRIYGGSLTVFYSLPREGSLTNMRYRIRRVGAACWLNRGSIRRCPGVVFYR